MNPQQPPYQQYPPPQPGWPGNFGRHSGGYPTLTRQMATRSTPTGSPSRPYCASAKEAPQMAVGWRRGRVAAHHHRIHVEAVPLKHKGVHRHDE
jgi:hypothetical protein